MNLYKIIFLILLILTCSPKEFNAQNPENTLSFENESYGSDQSDKNTISQIPLKINGIAVPSDFPLLEVKINETTSDGYLFLNNYNGNPYILILKNDGSPYFYRRVEDRSREFKVNTGNTLSRRVRGNINAYMMMDSLYKPGKIWKCMKGYETDDHEFQLTKEGTALMIGLDHLTWDLSDSIEGGKESTILANIIQETDSLGNVIFEWHAKDHFSIHDSKGLSPNNDIVDYVHINSIAVDYDNNLVISSRHFCECTKIDRKTGSIIWRLGGKNNQFEFINDEGFSYQHDFRPVPGKPGYYTLFDNGNLKNPQYSRAVEYRIDTLNMSAEKVWEFCPDPKIYTHWMGNVQRLPNGNTLINFAEEDLPKLVEVNPEGKVVYQANFKSPSQTYRSFRFKWNAIAPKPEVIIEKYPEMISLIFNKFGDEELLSYNIYLGTDPDKLLLYTNTRSNWINLGMQDVKNNRIYFIKVTGVYFDGSESQSSDVKEVYINFVKPGSNLIINGDFSQGDDYWNMYMHDRVSAEYQVNSEGKYSVKIVQDGIQYTDIQMVQEDISLVKGNEYVFEFEAAASPPRVIEAIIAKGHNPLIDVGKIGPTYIAGPEKRYSYKFKMLENSDSEARVIINLGKGEGDFTIDNLSLKQLVQTKRQEIAYKNLITVFPNPSSEKFLIQFNKQIDQDISLSIFDISGRMIKELPSGSFQTGSKMIEIDLQNTLPGIYWIMILKKNELQDLKQIIIQNDN